MAERIFYNPSLSAKPTEAKVAASMPVETSTRYIEVSTTISVVTTKAPWDYSSCFGTSILRTPGSARWMLTCSLTPRRDRYWRLTDIRIRQKTDYPERGVVNVSVDTTDADSASLFASEFRIGLGLQSARINGKPAKYSIKNSYLVDGS